MVQTSQFTRRLKLRIYLIIAVCLSLISALAKIVGGLVSNSYSLLADGLDSTINSVSMSLSAYLYLKSRKPPDREHPYGHYGYDAVSAIITSLIMVFLTAVIGYTIVLNIDKPHMVGGIGLVFAVFSTFTLILSVLMFRMLSLKLKSLALRAEVRHLRVDILESLLVLFGVLMAIVINPMYDYITAVAVISLMILGMVENLREVVETLTYKVPSQQLLNKVKGIALSVHGVKECHSIRARRLGDNIFLDLHILVDENLSIKEAHEIAHKVEDRLRLEIEDVVDVVVHVEPY